MTTTLRMFYARALFALCFFFLVFLVAGAGAGVAFAQDAAPAAAPEPDFLDLIFSTTGAAIGGLVAMVWAALKPPPWLQAIANALTTKEALNWENLLNSALSRLRDHLKIKITEATDRSQAIEVATGFLNTFYPEIVRWLDKDKNGVIDLIEPFLPPEKPGPKPLAPLQFTAPQQRAGGRRKEAVQ